MQQLASSQAIKIGKFDISGHRTSHNMIMCSCPNRLHYQSVWLHCTIWASSNLKTNRLCLIGV